MADTPETPESRNGNYRREEKLVRLASLYPSKSGTALLGNAYVAQARYVGSEDRTFMGYELITLIQECMDAGRKLRVLVFENNARHGAKSTAPYTIHLAVGDLQEDASPTMGSRPEPTPRPKRDARRASIHIQGPDIGTLPGDPGHVEDEIPDWGLPGADVETVPAVPVALARPPAGADTAPSPAETPTRPARRAAPRR